MASGKARRSFVAALSVAGLVGFAAAGPGASAADTARAATAKTIHPGVSVNYGNVTCTVGGVLREGHRLFLAIPASCGGVELGKTQDGCSAPQAPKGDPVSIQGAKHPGKLVYSSYSEMQLHGVKSPTRCYYNDLSLVRVDRRDRARVTAATPGAGIPQRVPKTLPAKGTALDIGTTSGTAGSTNHKGWELDLNSPTGMFKSTDCVSPVTAGHDLVGMLLILPKGAAPGIQSPPETYNLYRAIRYLRHTPGFERIRLLKR
ncbi:MAG: hypothetical protein ACTHK4_07035 [Mycobacteriales bacterium]